MEKLNKIVIVGVGLIGGSFAKGLKQAGLVNEMVGFGQNTDNLQKGIELGVIDSFTTDIAEAVTDADLVFLAVPLGAMHSVLQQMEPYLSSDTIVTDGGSAKGEVIRSAEAVFGKLPVNFVPGHPIAGKEKSGVTAADAELYVDHRVILTPTEITSVQALDTVKGLWSALGANIEIMQAQQHDEIFAATSHLPHLLAFSLVDMLNEHKELGDVFQYTAGGFRDFTRIASSDATMWRDISLQNSEAIAKWLKEYAANISHLTELVESRDSEALFKIFTDAKKARDEHIA